MSGWIGLLVSMVGMEPMHAFHRFTFGSLELSNGLGYLPILIGLFGLAEVIKALSRKTPETIAPQVGRIIPSFCNDQKVLRGNDHFGNYRHHYRRDPRSRAEHFILRSL